MARNLSPDLAYAEYLIERWAQWGKGQVPGAWPSITLLGRVIEQGFTGASQAGPLPEMASEVAAVEVAVLRLRDDERKVIVKHYVYWQPREVSARYCRMNTDQFDRVLHRARRRIADMVNGYFSRENWHVKQRA